MERPSRGIDVNWEPEVPQMTENEPPQPVFVFEADTMNQMDFSQDYTTPEVAELLSSGGWLGCNLSSILT